jgi:phage tail sheath protein FI
MPPISLTDVVLKSPGVYVSEERSAAPIAGVGTSTAGFIGLVVAREDTEAAKATQDGDDPQEPPARKGGQAKAAKPANAAVETALPETVQSDLAKPGEVKFCTNFTEFKTFFGKFVDGQPNLLAHAVFGFFRNGGTRCYVVGIAEDTQGAIDPVLEQFEAIDEIAIVAAPGLQAVRRALKEHCEKMGDRVAILDPPATAKPNDAVTAIKPFDSDYAALYLPWLLVFDPTNPKVPRAVPPSGHIAGIYARVDSQRGVFKAPANEVVAGVVGLAQSISKNQQDGLNKDGINCIRSFNGNIRVWGARTLGGDANGEFKYISTRRLFNYLRESIDEGTQWTVFEPNSPELWARIRRSVTAFLTVVWRSGALFGSTPEEAFYVKCDAENNPPEQRELGLVVTDIGVAVVKPAEFVVFRLSQRQEGQ